MDADCKTPVSVTVAKKAPASRPTPFPDAVRFVGIWALSTACLFLGSFTLSCALDNYYIPGDQCVEGDEWIWMMCAALQAAVAALALLLPCRHRWVNRALAYLALAATIVGHYMLIRSGVGLVLALNPERYLGPVCFSFTWILITCGFASVAKLILRISFATEVHFEIPDSASLAKLNLVPESETNRALIYLFVKACCIVTMVFLAAGDLVSILALILALILGGDD